VAGKATNNKLVLAGSRKPQMQREPRRNWTKDKEQEFLAALAETCNVTRAVECVGMSVRGAYKRRARNAAFYAAWMEAIGTAYQRLELALLDRAFNGTEKVVRRSDGSEDRMHEYPNQLGLSLLKMHRASVAAATAETPEEDLNELRDRVLKKLARLKRRRAAEKAEEE
jgi:hypothetical protein